jgi:hypothetical protein
LVRGIQAARFIAHFAELKRPHKKHVQKDKRAGLASARPARLAYALETYSVRATSVISNTSS